MKRFLRKWALLCAVSALVGCAHAPSTPPTSDEEWQAVLLPGKRATVYCSEMKEGRVAIAARADRSASLWRRSLRVPMRQVGEVEFSWWVSDLVPLANMSDALYSDAPARIVFAFAGDNAQLSPRNRTLFDLAHLLTGEAPPYATLMYVWDAHAPVGTVVVNARSDRIRKIVVESGPQNLRRWRSYRRNLADDFRTAFAEEPGALTAVAMMTDADNTQGRAEAWYGEIKLH
jgi:hypothetical protein